MLIEGDYLKHIVKLIYTTQKFKGGVGVEGETGLCYLSYLDIQIFALSVYRNCLSYMLKNQVASRHRLKTIFLSVIIILIIWLLPSFLNFIAMFVSTHSLNSLHA